MIVSNQEEELNSTERVNTMRTILCLKWSKLSGALAVLSTITVKPVLSSHLNIDKLMVLMDNGSLMKVKSIAECSPWSIKVSILQYF